MIERIAGRTDFVYQILDEYDGDKDIDKLLADSEMHVLTGKYLFYHNPRIFYRIHAEENPQECDEEKRKDDSCQPDASVYLLAELKNRLKISIFLWRKSCASR